MAFVVVIGTVAVYTTWVAGTSLVGAGAASVVGMAEPMLGAVFARALLAQSLTVAQSVGIATTAAGIVVVERARVRTSLTDVPVDLWRTLQLSQAGQHAAPRSSGSARATPRVTCCASTGDVRVR